MKLNDSIGFLINCTGRKLTQLVSVYFQPYDITPEQWGVLNQLGERDGISQKELAGLVEKDQTNLTRILDQLERKGLIRRAPNSADRRSFLAYLTDEGRSMVHRLAPIEEEALRIASKDLPQEKMEELKQMLNQIRSAIDQHSRMER